jgi:hypothetical protein
VSDACAHPTFESAVHVESATVPHGMPAPPPGTYRVDLQVRCTTCHAALLFQLPPTMPLAPQPVSSYDNGRMVRLHGTVAATVETPPPTWQPVGGQAAPPPTGTP